MINAQERLIDAQKIVSASKAMVANRLDILEDENLWSEYCLETIRNTPQTSYLSVPLYEKSEGVFSTYFFDAYPAIVNEPLNLFNITSTQSVFFREDVNLKMIYPNGETEDVTDILKHDSLKSTYFHKRLKSNEVTFLLSLKDYQKPLGASRFNVIEIDGFMPGAFKLKRLSLQYGDETINYEDFNKLGKNRIILDEKKQLNQIEFVFELLYKVVSNDTTYYPFALKHIYLLNADFKSESYAIVKIESDKIINLIKDECAVSSSRGITHTTLKTLGIEIYAHYTDNQLYMPIAISNAYEIYEIPLQVKTLYARVPIKKEMSSIGFIIINK